MQIGDRTVVGTYTVFGSGSSQTSFAQRDDDIERLVAFLDAAKVAREDDGDNGFVGTYSVPTTLAEQHRVVASTWFDPGASDRESPGLTYVLPAHAREGLRRGLRRVSEIYRNGHVSWSPSALP